MIHQPDPEQSRETRLDLLVRFAAVLDGVQTVLRDQLADTGKYTYRYADINAILHMLKPICAAQNLALSQPIAPHDDSMMMVTALIDTETGERLTFPGPVFPVKPDPQAVGSAVTYMRRYALVSLFGLEQADDDGQAAAASVNRPGERTDAEVETRKIVASMDSDVRADFVEAFKSEFGMALLDLPTGRHGDALGFTKQWMAPPPTSAGTTPENANE